MYYLLHRNQLHVSALLAIFRLMNEKLYEPIVSKHVVDFYVINNTYLFHQIVVLDIKYIPI